MMTCGDEKMGPRAASRARRQSGRDCTSLSPPDCPRSLSAEALLWSSRATTSTTKARRRVASCNTATGDASARRSSGSHSQSIPSTGMGSASLLSTRCMCWNCTASSFSKFNSCIRTAILLGSSMSTGGPTSCGSTANGNGASWAAWDQFDRACCSEPCDNPPSGVSTTAGSGAGLWALRRAATSATNVVPLLSPSNDRPSRTHNEQSGDPTPASNGVSECATPESMTTRSPATCGPTGPISPILNPVAQIATDGDASRGFLVPTTTPTASSLTRSPAKTTTTTHMLASPSKLPAKTNVFSVRAPL
mmetsp:Transcript_28063/g.50556  ORF Transcript_28063/g.50556 Transcript_28063/m.50556 type:complete len:306 (+) Transcript_28063:262-1179(+)